MIFRIPVLVFFRPLDLPETASTMAKERDFELVGYSISAKPEQLRPPRIVRIGVVQNKIVLPTSAPVKDQVNNFYRFFNVQNPNSLWLETSPDTLLSVH